MSKLKGFNIISPIVPYDSQDTYPTHYSCFGKGGLKSVASLDEIPDERLEEGSIAYVRNEEKLYQYRGTSWNLLSLGCNLKGITDISEIDIEKSFEGDLFYNTEEGRLYTIFDGEIEEVKLFDVKDAEDGKTYKIISSDSDGVLYNTPLTYSSDTLGIQKLKVGENEHLLGDGIELPEDDGTIALTSNIEEGINTLKTDEIDPLKTNVQSNTEEIENLKKICNVDSEGNDSNWHTVSTKENKKNPWVKFLTINGTYEEGGNNLPILEYEFVVSGKNQNNGMLFNDIILITLEGTSLKAKIIDNSNVGIFATRRTTLNTVEVYVKGGYDFIIHTVLSSCRNISDLDTLGRLNWTVESGIDDKESIVNIPSTSSITNNNTTFNIVPSVYTYYAQNLQGDISLDTDSYNVFILDSENTVVSDEEGKLRFKIATIPSEEKSFKFTFVRPKYFKVFQLYCADEEALKLTDLDLKDGESLYVTFSKSEGLNYWTYYLESSPFPDHDETLMLNDEGKLSTGMKEMDSGYIQNRYSSLITTTFNETQFNY